MDSEIRSAVRGVGSGGEGGVGRKAAPMSRAEEARLRAMAAASDAGHAIGKFVVGTDEVDEQHVDAALEVVTHLMAPLVHLKKNRKHPAVRLMLKQRMALAAELVMAFIRTSSRGAPKSPVIPVAWVPSRPPGITGVQRREIAQGRGSEKSGHAGAR